MLIIEDSDPSGSYQSIRTHGEIILLDRGPPSLLANDGNGGDGGSSPFTKKFKSKAEG